MAYSAIRVRKAMIGLNAVIKTALGHAWAAPEVLCYMIVRTPLDPAAVWFMSLLRFVYHAVNTALGRYVLNTLDKRCKHSRYVVFHKHLAAWGWERRDHLLVTKHAEVDLTRAWPMV